MAKKTALIIIISIIFTLGVTTVAIFARFLDNTDVRPAIVRADSLSYKERTDSVMHKSLANVESTKSLSVMFSQDELNLFINAYLKEKVPQSSGACFTFKENDIIYMEFGFKLGGIKTVVRANLKGTVSDEKILIELSDVKIGKTGGALTKILFTENNIKNILSENKIFASYNHKTSTIILSREQLKQTFKGFYEQSENADLYAVLINRAFAEKGMVNVFWSKNGLFGAEANLASLEYSVDVHGNIPYNITFENAEQKLAYLLDNAIISAKQSDIVFKYLIQGYRLLKDEEKLVIDKLSLTSIGIVQNSLYKSVLSEYEQSVTEIIASQLKNISISSGALRLSVDENALNNVFLKLPIIGQGSVYCVKTNDKYAVSHAAVESMYFQIVKDNINITLIVNLNGFKMAVACDFFGYSSSDFAFTTELKNTQIGSLNVTKEENNSLMKYLQTAFAEEAWIICDTDKQSITFDFDKVIDNKLFGALFMFGFNVNVSAKSGQNDIGYLAIDISTSLFK